MFTHGPHEPHGQRREVTLNPAGLVTPEEYLAFELHVVASNLYAYPDVTVVCDRSELEDERLDTLLNPTVLIEVLSPATERYDRGRKAPFYRSLEPLREYVFVSQDESRIERYTRTAEGQWILAEADRRAGEIALESIGCVLPLAEVYAGVE